MVKGKFDKTSKVSKYYENDRRYQRGMRLLYADYSRKQMSAHRVKIWWGIRQFIRC